MCSEHRQSYTIVVRLWPEQLDAETVVWRGALECVQTGERAYFQTLSNLATRIAAMLSQLYSRTDQGVDWS